MSAQHLPPLLEGERERGRGRETRMDHIRTVDKARWSLEGHTALVTGGSRGIGYGIVEELARLGASVYMCARTQAAVDSSLKKWREAGLSVEGSVCDVSLTEARTELMQKVAQHFNGKLDILVNNAGIFGPPKPITEISQQEYSSLMSTNFESAFHLCQLAHPLLKVSSKGSVVFISSVVGLVHASTAGSVYCISKAAMNHLTKILACEWSTDGIRVNGVAPGVVSSDMSAEALSTPEIKQRVLKHIPLGRMLEPEDIAAAVAFFCMPCSRYCTGQILAVDGGTMVEGLSKD